MRKLLSVCLPLLFLTQIAKTQIRIPDTYQLIYSQDFDSPQAVNDFEMTDEKAWKVSDDEGNRSLVLFGKSEYEARVRSPFNIALLEDVLVGDFILEIDLAQSGKEYGHRDLCLFFNVKDATNYYYVHIASKTDDHANNIFIVNDEPRTKISTKTNPGNDWGAVNSWHKARIERKVADGSIKIFFDDMETPIMEASDSHFVKGRIGFGSFDDTGKFDNIKIWAPENMQAQTSFFESGN